MMKKKCFLIFGPPGAGKGTQASHISELLSIPAISTGDIFRKNISEQTDLGIEIQGLVSAGKYVPDVLTNKVVANRLSESDTKNGFLLDGYPRTFEQVEQLDQILEAQGAQLNGVLLLRLDSTELINRLLLRAKTENRSDDTADVIENRQKIYQSETQPLVEIYRNKGILIEIDGSGSIEEVTDRITKALVSY